MEQARTVGLLRVALILSMMEEATAPLMSQNGDDTSETCAKYQALYH